MNVAGKKSMVRRAIAAMAELSSLAAAVSSMVARVSRLATRM